MVRTRATRDDQEPAPPPAAVRGRGRGKGRGCVRGAARAPARAAAEVEQIPEIILVQTEVPVQPKDGAAAFEDEQRRLESFKKYDPPIFSGLATDDALGFLEDCHHILHTMGITGSSEVSFTAFQLWGDAYEWWRTYELDSPNEAASLTWTQFSDMFLREFVPQSLRDARCAEFEHLRQGAITVLEYAIRYTKLARHAPALVATVRERVVSIARRVEGMHAREREEREGKRSRELGHFSGARTLAAGRHGKGYMSRPVHSALPASSNAPTLPIS
ncbi:uncharacterized protein [Nicotiana sylvestris]|uniref:uncharacterized protein n=1 Tax=Nicotiana sylvestris TaxID=4096 RepID=UPI00388CE52A